MVNIENVAADILQWFFELKNKSKCSTMSKPGTQPRENDPQIIRPP